MATLYRDFVLDGEIRTNSWSGRYEVSCKDLVLSFPEPEERDRSVRLMVDLSCGDINYRICQYLCFLDERPRPTTQEAGREALRTALREYAAMLIHPEVSPGAPSRVLEVLAGGFPLCPDCLGDGNTRWPEGEGSTCERCLGYGVNPRW